MSTQNSFVPFGAIPKKIVSKQTVSTPSQKQKGLYEIGKTIGSYWPFVSELDMRELSGILVYQYNQMKSSVDQKSGKTTWFARLFQGLSENCGYHNFIKQLASLYASQPSHEMWEGTFDPINKELRLPFSNTGIITVSGFLNALYYALVALADFNELESFTIFSRNEEVVENSGSEPRTSFNFLLNDQMKVVFEAATEGKSYIYTQRIKHSMSDDEIDEFIEGSIEKISKENDFKELNVIEKQSAEVPEKQVDHFGQSSPVQQNKSYSELFSKQDFESQIPDSQTPVKTTTMDKVDASHQSKQLDEKTLSVQKTPMFGVLDKKVQMLTSIDAPMPGGTLVVCGTTVYKAYEVRTVESVTVINTVFDLATNVCMVAIPKSEFALGTHGTLNGIECTFLPFVTEIK